MEIFGQILFAMLLLELFEIYIQSANTLEEMIEKLYGYYRQSIFLFFIIHPTLYFVIGVLLYFNAFNFFGITILVLKTFDLFFKIEIIQQRYIRGEMDAELQQMMGLKMTSSLKFFSLLLYLPLLYMAIFT